MYCTNCGHQIDKRAVICPICRRETGIKNLEAGNNDNLLGVLCFIVPVIGLIFYLIWLDSKPKSAKKAGLCGLLGVGTSLNFTILYIIFFLTILSALFM